MAAVPRRFLDETLWPEFLELNRELQAYMNDLTDRVIREGVDSDDSEPEIREQLPGAATTVEARGS